jgi:hypothetical protein
MASMSPALLGHFSRQLGPIYDNSFELVAMASQDGPYLLADLMRNGDRQVRGRLYSQRNLWVARQAVLDGDKQLAIDLIDQTIYRLGDAETEHKEMGWLCDRLSDWMARAAEHWRAANTRIEALWLALKGGGDG